MSVFNPNEAPDGYEAVLCGPPDSNKNNCTHCIFFYSDIDCTECNCTPRERMDGCNVIFKKKEETKPMTTPLDKKLTTAAEKKKLIEATKKSIQHWETNYEIASVLSDGLTGFSTAAYNCALCQRNGNTATLSGMGLALPCSGCPVSAVSGKKGCEGTPYAEVCKLSKFSDTQKPYTEVRAKLIVACHEELSFLVNKVLPYVEALEVEPEKLVFQPMDVCLRCNTEEDLRCLWHLFNVNWNHFVTYYDEDGRYKLVHKSECIAAPGIQNPAWRQVEELRLKLGIYIDGACDQPPDTK